ncbi:MAG: hypothetical protein NUV52_04685, partial [Candidatus Roizmanbacteria bacterium]|nr:hypothetical protein [Candidatus Roizmanbacteria bacterium]
MTHIALREAYGSSVRAYRFETNAGTGMSVSCDKHTIIPYCFLSFFAIEYATSVGEADLRQAVKVGFCFFLKFFQVVAPWFN